MSKATSVLVCVGKQYYKLHEMIEEYTRYGVSKRIPLQSIPEGLERGLSRIFVAHPDAIVKVTTDGKDLYDLAYVLYDAGLLVPDDWAKLVDLRMSYWTGQELNANDPVPLAMLVVTDAFSRADSSLQKELTETFGLVFCMGVVGWTSFEGFELVVEDGKETLPDGLDEFKHMIDSGYITPVHVEYPEEEDND
jgi:hypothetical protein